MELIRPVEIVNKEKALIEPYGYLIVVKPKYMPEVGRYASARLRNGESIGGSFLSQFRKFSN